MDRQLVAMSERISLVMVRFRSPTARRGRPSAFTSETTKIGSTLTTRRILES
jgi:hypothetical protein